ncbi:hypothetical protein MTP99_013487 [Tenebrio molitor]|nr:hypothetical protein MTP99_013487 [Tenebrio molitor]
MLASDRMWRWGNECRKEGPRVRPSEKNHTPPRSHENKVWNLKSRKFVRPVRSIPTRERGREAATRARERRRFARSPRTAFGRSRPYPRIMVYSAPVPG